MTADVLTQEQVSAVVQQALAECGSEKEELIPILIYLNREIGYLPDNALQELSRETRIPVSQIFSIASFYKMLSMKPVGKHIIRVCESAPCHVVGAQDVLKAIRQQLHIQVGETTPEGNWTLLMVSCLGQCNQGPTVVIDDDIYGNMKPAQVPWILAKYAQGGEE